MSVQAAIPGLTRVLAVELGTRDPKVRVDAVLPPEVSADERAEVFSGTRVKCEGRPAHVAAAVLHFLDTDFVTGTCLPVDGVRSVFAGGN